MGAETTGGSVAAGFGATGGAGGATDTVGAVSGGVVGSTGVGAGAAGETDPDATFEDQYEARANDWRATMIEKVSSARAVGVRV